MKVGACQIIAPASSPLSTALSQGRAIAAQLVRKKDWRKQKPDRYEFLGAARFDDATAEKEEEEGGEGSQIEDRTAGA